MKKLSLLIVILACSITFGQSQVEPRAKVKLKENTFYTIPDGKSWQLNVNTLAEIGCCESTMCKDHLNFTETFNKKAKDRKLKVEGTLTLSAGMVIKTKASKVPIIANEFIE